MIKFILDRPNLPNLVKDESIQKGTKQWWDLCITAPYSYEFRFLTYCRHENVAVEVCTMSTWDGKGSAYYPVNIPSIDYFSLMEKPSYQALVDGKLRFLLYYSEGDDPYEFMTDRIKKLCIQHNINRDHVQIVSANWYVRKLKKSAHIVLGNHDLHFLNCYFNDILPKNNDTLIPLLRDKKVKLLAEFLLKQPLFFSKQVFIKNNFKNVGMVHAGIPETMSLKESEIMSICS